MVENCPETPLRNGLRRCILNTDQEHTSRQNGEEAGTQMGHFGEQALSVTVGDMREEWEMDRVDGIASEPAVRHATKTAFGQPVSMCDDARQYLWQMAAYGQATSGFTTRWYSTDNVTCSDCKAVMARGTAALPTPEVVQGPSVRSTLLAEMQRQIKIKYRHRYGIDLDDPEWASEDYRPLRNRR